MKKDNLSQKLTGLRDDEVTATSRINELASEAESRDLTSDEIAEVAELETGLGETRAQMKSIEKILEIGDFHGDRNSSEGMNDDERRDFSFLRLIRALDPKATPKDRDAAGFELEMSRDVETRIGLAPRGAWVPNDVMGSWNPNIRGRQERRDLTADDFDQAAALIGTDFRPEAMIPLLRNVMAMTQLGATYLDGLVGDVVIPRQTGGGSASWLNYDGDNSTETNQTVGQVTLSPKTLSCYTDYTRQLRLQSSLSVENFIRSDLTTVMGLEIDRASLHGSGSSGEPVGVENTTGIGSQSFATGSTPTRSEVIGLRSDLANSNALLGTQAFVTGSTVYGNMLDTVIDAGSGQFLLSENGQLIGRQCVESNQVEAGKLFFGVWSDVMIGTWGGMDILVDPYTGGRAGTVRVILFQSTDLAVRQAASFSLGQ